MNTNKTTIKAAEDLLCGNPYGTFFGISQEIFDLVWQRLTDQDKNSVVYISMEIGADPDVFHPVSDFLRAADITSSPDPRVQTFIEKYLHGSRKIPNYSGGLGVLAGDTLKSFADNHIPVTAVSLLYREGYFSQLVDSKIGQVDHATRWHPEETPTLFQLHEPGNPEIPLEIRVPFFNSDESAMEVRAQVWMKMEVSERLDYFIPEFLIDYTLPSSPPWILEASRQLYTAKSVAMKVNQRRMLGSAVLPLMDKLGITARTIHLNEQHGVAVTLHLILRELENNLGPSFQERMTDRDILTAVDKVADRLVYTIHTPVKAGHDRFNRSFYSGLSQQPYRRILDLLASDEESPHEYNFTTFAMRVNRAVNSVSRLHRDVTRRQFPDFADKVKAITNGVHLATWVSDNRARVLDSVAELSADWRNAPQFFSSIDLAGNTVFRQQLASAWQQDNKILIDYVNNMLIRHRIQVMETWIEPANYLSSLDNGFLEPEVFTIGFARRFSTYKRAALIFDDIAALADILLKEHNKVNFIFAGKAHPQDEPGKTVLKQILDIQEKLFTRSQGLAKLVFIPGYDMDIAKMMVAGVHAWLNSPKRPLEASGTSGMKAAMNGVPNISVMDGWWVEGYHDGRTGWKFGYEGPVDDASMSESPDQLLYEEDSLSFYNLLPRILQTFYNDFDKYLDIAINNLCLNVPIFNTHRMIAEYAGTYHLRLEPEIEQKMALFRKLYRSDPENI